MFGGAAPADPSSESDSGVSEEPLGESPVAPATALPLAAAPAAVYQVVYDISGLGGAKAGLGEDNVISIELGKLWFLTDPEKLDLPPQAGKPDLGSSRTRRTGSCRNQQFVRTRNAPMDHSGSDLVCALDRHVSDDPRLRGDGLTSDLLPSDGWSSQLMLSDSCPLIPVAGPGLVTSAYAPSPDGHAVRLPV